MLDEAIRLRLVRPTTQYADGYGFHHGLIQATLYDAIPRGRRLALHDAVARALEQDPAVVAGEGLAEIAHHYLEAAPAHDPQRAIDYARRAGDRAMETFAYDQAVGMYRGALGVTGLTEVQRGGLLQALGEAQMRVGDTDAARQTLLRAADAARVREDPVAFAHAALGCAIWGLTNGTDEQLVGLAQEAVARLERVDEPGLMARVEGFLAAAIYWSDEVERRERLAEDALRLAREEEKRRRRSRVGPDTRVRARPLPAGPLGTQVRDPRRGDLRRGGGAGPAPGRQRARAPHPQLAHLGAHGARALRRRGPGDRPRRADGR